MLCLTSSSVDVWTTNFFWTKEKTQFIAYTWQMMFDLEARIVLVYADTCKGHCFSDNMSHSKSFVSWIYVKGMSSCYASESVFTWFSISHPSSPRSLESRVNNNTITSFMSLPTHRYRESGCASWSCVHPLESAGKFTSLVNIRSWSWVAITWIYLSILDASSELSVILIIECHIRMWTDWPATGAGNVLLLRGLMLKIANARLDS